MQWNNLCNLIFWKPLNCGFNFFNSYGTVLASWVSFSSLCFLRNCFISSRLQNSYAFTCSYYLLTFQHAQSPYFLLLTLIIFVFSFFFVILLAFIFHILLILSMNQLLTEWICVIVFLLQISPISAHIYMISLLLLL
jgi:hypothetical protein